MKKDGKGFSTKDVIMIILCVLVLIVLILLLKQSGVESEGRTGTAEPDAGRDYQDRRDRLFSIRKE